MIFFALFSLVCALSPTFIGLVVARAFQGIGAAFTIPPAQAHIALHFTDPTQKAKALGIWAPQVLWASSLDSSLVVSSQRSWDGDGFSGSL